MERFLFTSQIIVEAEEEYAVYILGSSKTQGDCLNNTKKELSYLGDSGKKATAYIWRHQIGKYENRPEIVFQDSI